MAFIHAFPIYHACPLACKICGLRPAAANGIVVVNVTLYLYDYGFDQALCWVFTLNLTNDSQHPPQHQRWKILLNKHTDLSAGMV